MMKSGTLILLLFLLPLITYSQNNPKKGNLVWSDEFEGTGIPDPAKWDRPEYNRRNNSKGPDGWWSRQDSYLDGNGNLILTVRKINNKNGDTDPYDYSVGAVRSINRFEKLYGIFEIRCKLPTQQGWWVAFWMMQGNVGSESNGGVDGSEVDIMEAFGWTDKINQAIHWDGYGDAHKSTGQKTEVPGIRDGFHTYTMEWYPDKYIFYIDGNETWRSTGGGVCNRPGYVKITGEISTEDWAINEYWSQNPAHAQYPDSFVVDYVRVYEFPSEEEVPPIRELVEKCYPEENLVVGAACHEHFLGTKTETILDKEFGYVTPANDFKQSYVHPEPGVWKWENSDTWVNHCRENNQVMRLHAPISPQCSPWAKDDSRTAEELEQNMEEYMTAICQRYNDSSQVKWLDVVNETVYHTDGSWFGPKPGNDSWENPWPKIGYDETSELHPPLYIKKAFEIANEYGTNLKLIINQHGMNPLIWDKIKKLVVYLRENNLRVDGIGWQAHIWLGWEKETGNMEQLAELIDWCHQNDLEFHITEFNVWLKPEDLGNLSEQAATFYAITKLAAEKAKNGFVGINFWHIRGEETQNKDRDGGPWAIDYEPKEAYYKIKEALCEASPVCQGNCGAEHLHMLIDTFGTGSSQNLLDGEWEGFHDANSLNSLDLENQDGYDGDGAKFEWTLKKGAVDYPFSGVQTWLNSEKKSADLSDYHAVKFQAKGKGNLKIGLITGDTEADGKHFFETIQLKDDWKNYELPFSDFKKEGEIQQAADAGNLVALIFNGTGDFDVPYTMYIDNIEFINKYSLSPVEPVEPPKPLVFQQPKVNQTGYLPNAFKEFSITADSLSASQQFVILDEENNEVYTGNVGSAPVDDTDISGEKLFKGNFSDFTVPGLYRIKAGTKSSFAFQINKTVYDSVLYYALRDLSLFRANSEIDDPVTGLHVPEGHLTDAEIPDGSGNLIDLSGGWYNDGGFGKYVPSTAFACAQLMNLYEINPAYFKLQQLKIPESDNNLPDILDQVKTGIMWLLKMQREDGAVYHKVDSEPDFAYGYGPDEDPFERKLGDPENLSTVDAADFTAVVAHAARIFASVDSLFSEQCKSAAIAAWQWVQANPGIGQEDVYFTDPQSWQEEMWAKAEMFMLTGDQSFLGNFYSDLTVKPLSEPELTQPQLLSFASLYLFPGVPAVVKNRIQAQVENYAAQLQAVADKSGYGTAVDKFGWDEGSNFIVSNMGATFAFAHQITGNGEWLKYAAQQLDYLMGRNSLNHSFVTGFGENSSTQPYHWISKTYGIVPKGFLVKGAVGAHMINNPNTGELVKELMEAGFPSAKIYTDTINSRSSNEVGIFGQSSFAFLAGYLALNDREITNAPLVANDKNTGLRISAKNYSLYCTNCTGPTEVDLFSIDGRLLDKEVVQAFQPELKLVNYRRFLETFPIILYRVSDETGRSERGKLTHPVR